MASSFGFSTASSSTPFSAPRRGPPPLPIRVANGTPSHVGTSLATDKAHHRDQQHRPATPNQSPATLLYELPPSSPRSPQLSSSKNRSRSPPHSSSRPDTTRISFGSALQSHPRQGGNNGLSDTLNSGNIPRSLRPKSRQSSLNDPLEPKQEDLDAFADLCRKWYYGQDELSGRLMSQTLANTAPAHRATYTRLQASVRSAFHTDQSVRRISEFRALLSATEPGNSLSLAARSSPSGSPAKRERHVKVEKFIRSHCVSGVPGTHPFFDGLYSILRLQTLPETLGGAGGRVIKWEIDDAVFIETAGKEFTHDAVDILKGVLGFDESLNEISHSFTSFDMSRDPPIAEDESTTLVGSAEPTAAHISLSSSRGRAPSNPFLDPSRSHQSTLNNAQFEDPSTPTNADTPLIPRSSSSRPVAIQTSPSGSTVQSGNSLSLLNEPQLRTWTFPPSVANPEIHKLMRLFPSFIVQRSTGRFPTNGVARTSKGSERMLEEGTGDGGEQDVKIGTGRMWLSEMERENGWQGGFWDRVIQWFKNLFG